MAVEERKAAKQSKSDSVGETIPKKQKLTGEKESEKVSKSNRLQNDLSSNQQLESSRSKDSITEDQLREHIATAAYYNAERRGFQGGNELDDWLEAERQIGGNAVDRRAQATKEAKDKTEIKLDDGGEKQEVIEPDQIKQWAKKLGVTSPVLREAINRIGSRVDDVKSYLRDSQTKH